MKRLVYIFFILVIGNCQVAHAQLYAIQKLDAVVLSDVKLKRFGGQLEGNAIVRLKIIYDYEISNKVNTLLKFNTDDFLNEDY